MSGPGSADAAGALVGLSALFGAGEPAIALSAHVSEDYQARTRTAGFDFHLGKPYDVAELVRLALTALGRSRKVQ